MTRFVTVQSRVLLFCIIDEDIPPIVTEVNVVKTWSYGVVSCMVVLGMTFGLMCLIFNIVFKNRKYVMYWYQLSVHVSCLEVYIYLMK